MKNRVNVDHLVNDNVINIVREKWSKIDEKTFTTHFTFIVLFVAFAELNPHIEDIVEVPEQAYLTKKFIKELKKKII